MRSFLHFVLLVAISSSPLYAQTTDSVTSGLTADDRDHFWTAQRTIPMCWHILQFPTQTEEDSAKAFVMKTVKEGWLDLIDLNSTWTDCPTAGDAKHVRVLLRSGDPGTNGTTLKPGTLTLSTAADRLNPPPNDPPGLLMGFPANWNTSAAARAQFQALILHEFGHVLGFGHEQNRPDGSGAACYNNDFPDTVKIGPPDPRSIMGWSYCDTALSQLSLEDMRGVRSVYGPRPILNLIPAMIGITTVHVFK